MKKLSDFISVERARFENRYNNMFSFTFSEILRYYDYLQIILSKYKSISEKFADNFKAMQTAFKGNGTVNDEQMKLLLNNRDIHTRLHLEIESFYLFAKILLDKIAIALQFYFGSARGLPLSSHDKLTKNFEGYLAVKRLTNDPKLLEEIKKLKEDISDFRDKQIQHIQDFRQGRVIRATGFDGSGNTRISLTTLYPTEKDKQYDSRLLPEMLTEIEGYISQVIELIENNRDKTALPFEKVSTKQS